MIDFEKSQQLIIEQDSINPRDWHKGLQDRWCEGESKAYSLYRDSRIRIEQEKFFTDYFLQAEEPIFNTHFVPGSINNCFYFLSGSLVAFSSLFICDFRNSPLEWHGLNLNGTIGIIPRKAFSLRIPELLDKSLGIPFVRVGILKYIWEISAMYPAKTKFSICGHFQPESLVLIRNLVKAGYLRAASKGVITSPKLEATLKYLPKDILDSFKLATCTDVNGTAFMVGTFNN